jgi:YggT family protein
MGLYFIRTVVDILCGMMSLALLARAILSWVANPYRYNTNNIIQRLYSLLVQLTEPIVAPCRKLLSRFNTGMFDFSVLVAMLVIMLVRNLAFVILR